MLEHTNRHADLIRTVDKFEADLRDEILFWQEYIIERKIIEGDDLVILRVTSALEFAKQQLATYLARKNGRSNSK